MISLCFFLLSPFLAVTVFHITYGVSLFTRLFSGSCWWFYPVGQPQMRFGPQADKGLLVKTYKIANKNELKLIFNICE